MNTPIALVTLAGNLATGKSTLFKNLMNQIHFTALPEDISNNVFLPRFSESPSRWGVHNFIWFLKYRLHQQEKSLEEGNSFWIQERSLQEDLFVFLPAYRDAGYLSTEEFELLQDVGNHLSKLAITPTAFICMQCPVALIMDRIKRRSQAKEDALPYKYFEILNHHFQIWYSNLAYPKILLNTSELNEEKSLELALNFITRTIPNAPLIWRRSRQVSDHYANNGKYNADY